MALPPTRAELGWGAAPHPEEPPVLRSHDNPRGRLLVVATTTGSLPEGQSVSGGGVEERRGVSKG